MYHLSMLGLERWLRNQKHLERTQVQSLAHNDDNPQRIEDAFAQFLYLEDVLYRFYESFHGVILCKL